MELPQSSIDFIIELPTIGQSGHNPFMRFFLSLSLFLTMGIIGVMAQDPWNIPPGTGKLVQFPDPLPLADGVTEPFDQTVEHFFVYVPRGYNPANKTAKYGMIVFLNQDAADMSLPKGWGKVLDEHKLFLIAPSNVGREVPFNRRIGLSVSAALAMERYFPLDNARIYSSGVYGGAKVASILAFNFPALFHGTIQCNGTMYYKDVPRAAVTKADLAAHPESYSYYPCTNFQSAKQVRFVLITGSKDYRRHFILDVYHGGFKADGYYALLIDIPGTGIQICSGATLEKALDYIEDTKTSD